MKEFTYTVTDPNGIHARPAGVLVKQLKNFSSSVTIFKGDKNVDMKKLLALMGLGVKQGDTVTVKVEGEDEEACVAELLKAFQENF
ncbi:MAG: HPr family phosphocarrier protein [Eubacteriales bacterium]|nr:HPr family phosphocarrier protein [Eubacteriales bacterium]